MNISNWAITVTSAHCVPGYYGSAVASGTYSWDSYSARYGAFSNQNRYQQNVNNGYSGFFFQNGSFNSSCYYEMSG